MRYYCDRCKDHKHCNGSESVRIFDQDGPGWYVCECYCAIRAREKQRVEQNIRLVIRENGKELVQRILNES